MPEQCIRPAPEGGILSRFSKLAAAGRRLEANAPCRRVALVVDDDPAIPPLVAVALDKYGFVVDSVTDGVSALSRARSRSYDLIILDLGMAELDGFEVLQTMKREDALRDIPVLVLTADDSDQALARSFGFGADDFVTKPFRPEELGIRGYRLTQPLATANARGGFRR